MANLETYRDKFAESGWQIFERAISEALRRGQKYLGVEHILYTLVQEKAEHFISLLRSLSDNPDALTMLLELIEERVKNAPKHEGQGVRLATETIGLFKRTLSRVRSNGRQRIEATDLFITLMMEEKSLLRELLSKLLSDPQAKRKQARDLFAVVESVSAASNSHKQRKYNYVEGEMVRIKSGPFAAFTGRVEMVDEEKGVLNVRVSIFGYKQPVELRFIDVEKIKFVE